jgi:hypothetical protein
MAEFLPIGSVVILKGGTKKIMICGRLQRQNDTGQLWDYSACFFPEGIINPQELFLFNNESVDKLVFLGLRDGDELELQRYLLEQAEVLRSGKSKA